jgi:uncharacterized UBP type Zn finger protein
MSQLAAMGFPHFNCEKVVINTSNIGVKDKMNWLLCHMEDLGFGL